MSISDNDTPVTQAELKAEMSALERRLLAKFEEIEADILGALRETANGAERKLKVNDILVRSFDDRLNATEERVGALERRAK